jgi:hypothetical protein
MQTIYNGLPVALSWAIDATMHRYAALGGDVAEVSALLARAIAGDDCDVDAVDARESLTDILPGLEFLPA